MTDGKGWVEAAASSALPPKSVISPMNKLLKNYNTRPSSHFVAIRVIFEFFFFEKILKMVNPLT